MDFEATDQILIISTAFVKYWIKWVYNEVVHQLFILFKKSCDLVTSEVLHDALIELVST